MKVEIIDIRQLLPSFGKPLLEEMFADCQTVKILHRFTAGLSGSYVFQVRPKLTNGAFLRTAIVKLDWKYNIEREWAASQRIDKQQPSNTMDIQGEPTYLHNRGGLSYPVAGNGDFDVESFADFYRANPLQVIQLLLQKWVAKSLSSFWKLNSRPEPDYQFQAHYDADLPDNYVIRMSARPQDQQITEFTPATIQRYSLKNEQFVKLVGFRVARIHKSHHRLFLEPSQTHDGFRLRVNNVANIEHYREGMTLQQPIIGIVKGSRRDFFVAELKKATIQVADVSAESIPLPTGGSVANPITKLPSILKSTLHVTVGPIHGDLNMENILVETSGQGAYFIDFARSKRDHVLRDLLHLEMAVVTQLGAETFVAAAQSADAIIPFYRQLHVAMFNPAALHLPKALEKLARVILAIRQIASHHLFEKNAWREYYTGLFLYLMGALRFGSLDKLTTAPHPKQIAFWGAAVSAELITAKSGTPASSLYDTSLENAPAPQMTRAEFVTALQQLNDDVRALHRLGIDADEVDMMVGDLKSAETHAKRASPKSRSIRSRLKNVQEALNDAISTANQSTHVATQLDTLNNMIEKLIEAVTNIY
ncbi:MAG: phosphotransferase [Candidatus Promineifilaceae bacterium]